MPLQIGGAAIMADERVEQVIILAAGKSLQLDGVSKLLVRHPHTGKTILDYAIEAFPGKHLIVVVGYKAIDIMQRYPQLDFVYNPDWALTNNAMSLALALNDKPTYVLSGDIFVSSNLIQRLEQCTGDIILTSYREKRSLTAIHCIIDSNGFVTETYQGPLKSMSHPESVGLFKICTPKYLREWQRRCFLHSNLFAGQLLPYDFSGIQPVELENELFFEINTPADYINLIEESRTV